MNRPTPLLAIAIALVSLLIQTAPAAERDFTIIARQGQPADGFDDGTFYGGFGFNFPSVGAGGHVAFFSTLSHDHVRGIWSGQPGALSLVTKFKDPLPGGDEGDTMELDAVKPIVVCPDGSIVFETEVDTAIAGRNRGIFAGKPGELKLVALVNHPVPPIAGATYHPFGWRWFANGEGTVLLNADLGGAVSGDDDQAILRWHDGTTTVIARLGSQAAGFPAGATYSQMNKSVTINRHGDLAFAGKIRGSGAGIHDAHGLWRKFADTGDLVHEVELVYAGRTGIPGLPYDWNTFEYPRLDDDGAIAFEASAMNQVTDPRFGEHFFYRDPDGQLSLLAREKAPAPGTAGQNYNSFLFYEPLAGGAGHAMWTGGFGPDNDNNQRGIYARKPDGTILPVLLEGDPAPGLPGVSIKSNELNGEPCINASGAIVCSARLEGAGIDFSNDLAVWAGFPGNLKLVVQRGDTLRLADGSTRTIGDIRYTHHGGSQDGYPTALNDAGRFVFKIGLGGNEALVMIDDITDLDGDGISDLFNDAFGGGKDSLPYIELEGGTRFLVFRRPVTPGNFVYQAQHSADLTTWETIGSPPAAHPDQGGIPAGFERVRVALPDGTDDSFARIKIGIAEPAP